MKVFVQGSGTAIDLTQKDYLAQGGEGTVFVKGKTAYKIYHDPKKMLPMGKVAELVKITDPTVIRPQSVLLDAKGIAVGYTMPYIDGGYPLCQLFPRSFREREGVTPQLMADLVAKLRKSVDNIHQAGILVVDLNEMNFLVPQTFDNVFCIDADSYQTISYPATAIMDSIRDWTVHHNQWSELSDWYSFAVLSFQMFTGIHPFRGKYHGPNLDFRGKIASDDPNDAFAVTRRRMLGNISVMHPEVGIPTSAYPLTAIPPEYQKWFDEVFVKGNRLPPPGKAGNIVAVFVPTVTTTLHGTYIEFHELMPGWDPPGPVTAFFASPVLGGNPVIETTAGLCLDRQIVPVPMHRAQVCGFTPRVGRAVVGVVRDGKLQLTNVTDRATVPFAMTVKDAASYDGRIYVQTAEQIHEVLLTDMGSQIIASTKAVANIMPHATRLYSGVALQSMLGSAYASLFIGSGMSQQVRITELDKHRIIDAKFDHGVMMVVAEHGGKYDRMVFRFDTDGTYDVRVVKDISSGWSINFVTLDTGVCVCLTEEDKLELFSNRKGSTSVKIVDDSAMSSDMTLAKQGGSVLALHGKKVFKLKMK